MPVRSIAYNTIKFLLSISEKDIDIVSDISSEKCMYVVRILYIWQYSRVGYVL